MSHLAGGRISHMRRLNLLVVDDSVFLNHAFSTMFSEKCPFPCRMFQAFSLSEAQRILTSNRIDYLILDLVLPDGKGEELLDSIRDRAATKVIVMTSQHHQIHRRERLFRAGILDYFPKTNPLPYLCLEIINLIQRTQTNSARTVMVIDDSSTVTTHVRNIFENRSYRVITASDASEALTLLDQTVPDIILLDIEMPQIRGDEMLRRMQESEAWMDIPVIVMTASTDEETKIDMLKHGAQSVIEKPFSIESLIAKTENAISVKEGHDHLKSISHSLKLKVEHLAQEIQEKQEMLNSQKRQVAMGEMFSAIIHQWMQPLNMISLICEDLSDKGKSRSLSPDEFSAFEDKIDDYIRYMKEVAENFQNFFKPVHLASPFSVIGSTHEIIRMLEGRYHNIEIRIEGDESITVNGYKNEFQQVIINLLDNAKDAFDSANSSLIIEIDLVRNGNHYALNIRDNGPGLIPDVYKNLFKPYVTSKKNGTGIGLYLSRKILSKIGATIRASNHGNGAEFTILFHKEH